MKKIAGLKTMMKMKLEVIMVSFITKTDMKKRKIRRDINDNLFRKYFRYQDPGDMLEDVNSTKTQKEITFK